MTWTCGACLLYVVTMESGLIRCVRLDCRPVFVEEASGTGRSVRSCVVARRARSECSGTHEGAVKRLRDFHRCGLISVRDTLH